MLHDDIVEAFLAGLIDCRLEMARYYVFSIINVKKHAWKNGITFYGFFSGGQKNSLLENYK